MVLFDPTQKPIPVDEVRVAAVVIFEAAVQAVMVQLPPVMMPPELLPVPVLRNALQLVSDPAVSTNMPNAQVLYDAVQLIRVESTEAEIGKVTVLCVATQLIRVEPRPDEKPALPVLPYTWHDSINDPGPARMAVEVHAVTARS